MGDVAPRYLYRSLIVLLDALGVPHGAFDTLQANYLEEIGKCVRSHAHAERLLVSIAASTETGEPRVSALGAALAAVKSRVPLGEPFLAGVLGALRSSLVS